MDDHRAKTNRDETDMIESKEAHYPLQALLGYEITDWQADCARVELLLRDVHQNRHGIPHGGIYAVLIDTAAGFAGCWRPPSEPPAYAMTLSLNVNFVGLPQSARLIAEARRIGGGRNLFFSAIELRDDVGTLVATGSGTHRYRKSTGNPV